MYIDVANRGHGKIHLQRLPVVAVIEGHRHSALRSGVQQTLADRIFANGVHGNRQTVGDQLPALSAVVGAVDVRTEIVEAMTIDGHVRRVGIELRGFDDSDFRPRCHRGRRDVLPMRALVARTPDLSVIRSNPDVAIGSTRRRDRVDDALPRAGTHATGGRDRVEIRRRPRIFARQIGTDDRPMLPAILRTKEALICKVKNARISRRENERQRPRRAIVSGIRDGRVDRMRLHRAQIEFVDAAAVKNLRVFRIGREVVALATGSRLTKIREADSIDRCGVTRHTGRTGILLRSIDPVWKLIVGGDVIELAGRLVVPGAPRFSAVHRDDRSLIDAENPALGMFRIDPQRVVVVAARRAFGWNERLAGILRSIHVHVDRVDDIGVLRLDRDAAEVPAARPDPRVVARARPRRAAVVGAIHAAGVGRRHRWSDSDSDPSDSRRQSLNCVPVIAAVGGFVKSAARSVRRRIDVPRRAARLPQRGVNHFRVARLEVEIDRAGVVVRPENFLPALSAVAGAEDSTLRIRSVWMPEGSDVDEIRIVGMDENLPDLLRVREADVRPRFPAVEGLVHAVALRDVGAHVGFTAAGVDDLRIRARDCQCSDRSDRLRVENRLPGAAGVVRFPNAAVHAAEIKMFRFGWNAADRENAAGAKRSDQPPMQILKERRVDRRRSRRCAEEDCEEMSHGRGTYNAPRPHGRNS